MSHSLNSLWQCISVFAVGFELGGRCTRCVAFKAKQELINNSLGSIIQNYITFLIVKQEADMIKTVGCIFVMAADLETPCKMTKHIKIDFHLSSAILSEPPTKMTENVLKELS